MKYCSRCLYPENHPLYITLDDKNVCSGCRVHEEKDQLDWFERADKLRSLTEQYKAKSRVIHDCIVPVSGARDSYFIVDYVVNQLGLNPLLVTYNKHYNTQVGIRNLAYLRSLVGADIMSMNVSPERVKQITRETLRLRGSMYWHCLAGQSAFPVQVATKFKIPLIIWGAHQGVDQVGMFSHLDEVEMTRKYRKEHDLMSLDAVDLLKESDTLMEKDITPFLYPHAKEIEAVGVKGIYLNNYIRWDTKKQHELMINKYGYESNAQQRTFDCYNDVDCSHYSALHDYIKFIKFGYGKVTDHACREIRLKRLTREEGIALVQKYSDIAPNGVDLFAKWLDLSEQEILGHVDKFRDAKIWTKDSQDSWSLKDSIVNHSDDGFVEEVRLDKKESCEFIETGLKSQKADEDYTLIGRGWVDSWEHKNARGSVSSKITETVS